MGKNVTWPKEQVVVLADVSRAAIIDVPGPSISPMPTMDISATELARQAADLDKSLRHVFDAALKRTIDFAVAAVLLVLTSPLFGLLAILVALDGGPIFFGHCRIGRSLRPFVCFKFRTMIPNAETTLTEYLELNHDAAVEWERDHKLAFDIRVTPAGRILRKTSLDELPQLWNVLRGDMSLVGPRPITTQESKRYGASLGAYAALRPGMTGLWQVSGRNELSYRDRVVMDVRYARSRSIWSDLSILLIDTPRILLSRRGAR